MYFDLPFEFSGRIVVAAVSVAARATITTAVLSASVGTVGDVLFGNLCTCALVNFLLAYLACELLAALGYAALLAKNLLLTDAPRRLLPLLAVSILAVATVLLPCLSSVSFTKAFKLGQTVMNCSPTGMRNPFRTLACTVFMYSATAAFIIEGSILVLRHIPLSGNA